MTSKVAELREKFNQQPHIVNQLGRTLTPRKERAVQSTSPENTTEVEDFYFKATIKGHTLQNSTEGSKEIRATNNEITSTKTMTRNGSLGCSLESESTELRCSSVVSSLPSNHFDQYEQSSGDLLQSTSTRNKPLLDNNEFNRTAEQYTYESVAELSPETGMNESDIVSLESVLPRDAMFYCYTEEYPNFRRRNPRNILFNKIKPNMKPY